MSVRLSILIATIPSRQEQFWTLYNNLIEQSIGLGVEIICDSSLDYNIGCKRNKLLNMATGDYVVFVDDDDLISEQYVSLILQSTETKPDCIGISGTITTNGTDERQWHISKDHGRWSEHSGIYYRTPNHISPVKREIALQAMFPELTHGEDYAYSMKILPLLQTEVVIKENIYKYQFISNK